ncbi:MAG: polysaccharide biosynthesis protein [Clostridia bacterium]|nr:polysaccharide biosynthesis protein [Clostridia bacterium]
MERTAGRRASGARGEIQNGEALGDFPQGGNGKHEGKGGFLKGAAWIALGGFVAKLIGGLYRIPLTNIIGGRGLGLYQLVYPVYCLFLTASTGVPSTVAKLTAEQLGQNKSAEPLFRTAMKLFFAVGLVATALMAIVAPFIAKAQGAEEVLGGYYALAPSVVLVSVISVFRGYFQGANDMLPTALSEVVEQIVKVGLGLLFAYFFRGDIAQTVVWLLVAVSLSEVLALLMLFGVYRRGKSGIKRKNEYTVYALKPILRLVIPVTVSGVLLPASALLDSVLVPRLLSRYADDAVTLFGLFSGGAATLINLPVSICYGIAAASVPIVAKAAVKGGKEVWKRVRFALFTTAAVALPCALGLYLFADIAVKIVFRNLSATEAQTLIRLTKALAVSTLTLSCAQTLSACLTAQGKPKYAAFSWFIALSVKTAAYLFWLKDPSISVLGLAYATNLAYLVAFLLDLLYNFYVSKKRKVKRE